MESITQEAPKVSYDEKRRYYKEIYEGDVDPPNPNLKITTVIPTFAELKSDNFWRMFRGLMYQRGVSDDEYEVICVINNSQTLSWAENDRSLGINSFEGKSGKARLERYRENQDQINIIKIAKEGQEKTKKGESDESVSKWIDEQARERGISLSDVERSLLNRFTKTGISLQFVDASSPGRAFTEDPDTSPISLARDIGSYIAQDRFRQLGRNGIVDFIDGDCFFDPNYVREVIKLFDEGALVVAKPLQKVIAEIPRQIEDAGDRITRINSAISYLITYYGGTLNYYDIIGNYESGDFPIRRLLGGPQIAIRSDCLVAVDGYPTEKLNGDWTFSKNVGKKYRGEQYKTMTGAAVLMSDRGRDVSIDGRNRGREVKLDTIGRGDEQTADTLRHAISHLKDGDSSVDKSIRDMASAGLINEFQAREEYRRLKESLFREEADKRIELIGRVKRFLTEAVATDFKNKSGAELIKKLYEDHKLKRTDKEFLDLNPVLTDLIVEILNVSSQGQSTGEEISEKTFQELKNLLPEFFETPPPSAPDIYEAGEGANPADYAHIDKAVYIMKARLRESLFKTASNSV